MKMSDNNESVNLKWQPVIRFSHSRFLKIILDDSYHYMPWHMLGIIIERYRPKKKQTNILLELRYRCFFTNDSNEILILRDYQALILNMRFHYILSLNCIYPTRLPYVKSETTIKCIHIQCIKVYRNWSYFLTWLTQFTSLECLAICELDGNINHLEYIESLIETSIPYIWIKTDKLLYTDTFKINSNHKRYIWFRKSDQIYYTPKTNSVSSHDKRMYISPSNKNLVQSISYINKLLNNSQ